VVCELAQSLLSTLTALRQANAEAVRMVSRAAVAAPADWPVWLAELAAVLDVPPTFDRTPAQRLDLTGHEAAVLRALASGGSQAQVAMRLDVPVSNVRLTLRHVGRRMGLVSSPAAAVLSEVRRRGVDLPSSAREG
jgi:DNA-binding NarL/FixJ family response regulator